MSFSRIDTSLMLGIRIRFEILLLIFGHMNFLFYFREVELSRK